MDSEIGRKIIIDSSIKLYVKFLNKSTWILMTTPNLNTEVEQVEYKAFARYCFGAAFMTSRQLGSRENLVPGQFGAAALRLGVITNRGHFCTPISVF